MMISSYSTWRWSARPPTPRHATLPLRVNVTDQLHHPNSQTHTRSPEAITNALMVWSGAKRRDRQKERERATAKKMLPRRARDPAAGVLTILPAILLLAVAAAMAMAAAEEALPMPMEVYFTPAELARIAGYGEEPVSSVSVSGQLTCELCLRPGSQLLALDMPGTPKFLALFLLAAAACSFHVVVHVTT